ncbi:hypothetical protein VTN96DRAFT_10408 [Rasamsonia emersonii]
MLEPSKGPELTSDPLILLYYQNFHHAHPILLPQQALSGPLRHYIPSYVLTVMRYIGAHYHRDPSVQAPLKETAWEVVSDAAAPRNGFQVQCMLLLAITAHAHGEDERAHQIVQSAVDLALDLGMHRASFAVENSLQNPLVEEMWRRTYWELYVVDGLLSALREQNSFSLYDVKSDLALPCDELVYDRAEFIPRGYTLEEFMENRRQHNLSSFAYRVDAVRLMGAVLAHGPPSGPEDEFEALNNALTEWFLHLPSSENDTIADSGRFDEMFFQAQMIVYSAIINLHRPRSSLKQVVHWGSHMSCRQDPARLEFSSFDLLDPSTKKIIRAADSLSNLLTLPGPIKRHSPFLINGLLMGVLVHTAAALSSSKQSDESFKVRVELAVGVLNRLAESWPLARDAKHQVLKMYREVVQRLR